MVRGNLRVFRVPLAVGLAVTLLAWSVGAPAQEVGCHYECETGPYYAACLRFPDSGHPYVLCSPYLSCIRCIDWNGDPDICCWGVCDVEWCFTV